MSVKSKKLASYASAAAVLATVAMPLASVSAGSNVATAGYKYADQYFDGENCYAVLDKDGKYASGAYGVLRGRNTIDETKTYINFAMKKVDSKDEKGNDIKAIVYTDGNLTKDYSAEALKAGENYVAGAPTKVSVADFDSIYAKVVATCNVWVMDQKERESLSSVSDYRMQDSGVDTIWRYSSDAINNKDGFVTADGVYTSRGDSRSLTKGNLINVYNKVSDDVKTINGIITSYEKAIAEIGKIVAADNDKSTTTTLGAATFTADAAKVFAGSGASKTYTTRYAYTVNNSTTNAGSSIASDTKVADVLKYLDNDLKDLRKQLDDRNEFLTKASTEVAAVETAVKNLEDADKASADKIEADIKDVTAAVKQANIDLARKNYDAYASEAATAKAKYDAAKVASDAAESAYDAAKSASDIATTRLQNFVRANAGATAATYKAGDTLDEKATKKLEEAGLTSRYNAYLDDFSSTGLTLRAAASDLATKAVVTADAQAASTAAETACSGAKTFYEKVSGKKVDAPADPEVKDIKADITAANDGKVSKAEIETALRAKGYTTDEIEAGFAAYGKIYWSVENATNRAKDVDDGLSSAVEIQAKLVKAGFTADQAKYGAVHAGIRWSVNNATNRAQKMDNGKISATALQAKLVAEAGFTETQAKYGVVHSGIRWSVNNATNRAKELVKGANGIKTIAGVKAALKAEGFTENQANYGAKHVGLTR